MTSLKLCQVQFNQLIHMYLKIQSVVGIQEVFLAKERRDHLCVEGITLVAESQGHWSDGKDTWGKDLSWGSSGRNSEESWAGEAFGAGSNEAGWLIRCRKWRCRFPFSALNNWLRVACYPAKIKYRRKSRLSGSREDNEYNLEKRGSRQKNFLP